MNGSAFTSAKNSFLLKILTMKKFKGLFFKVFLLFSVAHVRVNAALIKSKIVASISKQPKEVAADYFKFLFKTGDIEGIKRILAADAVYSQAEGLPYGGTYVGFEQLLTMFTKAQSYFDLQIVGEPVYFVSESNPDAVIINFTIKCVSKKTKREMIMPIAEYFKVKDGLIKEIRPFYFDTKTFSQFLN